MIMVVMMMTMMVNDDGSGGDGHGDGDDQIPRRHYGEAITTSRGTENVAPALIQTLVR